MKGHFPLRFPLPLPLTLWIGIGTLLAINAAVHIPKPNRVVSYLHGHPGNNSGHASDTDLALSSNPYSLVADKPATEYAELGAVSRSTRATDPLPYFEPEVNKSIEAAALTVQAESWLHLYGWSRAGRPKALGTTTPLPIDFTEQGFPYEGAQASDEFVKVINNLPITANLKPEPPSNLRAVLGSAQK